MSFVQYYAHRHCIPLAIIGLSCATLAFLLAASALHKVPVQTAIQPRALAPPSQSVPRSSVDILLRGLGTDPTDLAVVLHRQATIANVELDEVTYDIRRESDLPVQRRTASFELTDSYVNIRRFLNGVLNAQPNIALEALDCHRDDIDSTDVDCAIRIARYQRTTATVELIHGG